MPVEPFFRSDRDILPLQAADLLAWMVRQRISTDGQFEFAWIDEELSGVTRSDFTARIGWKPSDGTLDSTDPEYLARRAASRQAFRETFGFNWPPRNASERKKMRGR
jgi:hypothetical protein